MQSFLSKILVFLTYKRDDYLFYKSKKYISSWGEGTYGAPKVICFDSISRLNVGRYVSVASNVSILLGANHKRGLITTYPLSRIDPSKTPQETNEKGDVVIGSDVWIGYGVTIIGPATIGDGCIIGASALVLGDVPPYAVVGGVPAKIIKYRFSEDQIKSLLRIKWWDWGIETIAKRKSDIYSGDVDSFIELYQKSE